LNFEVPLFCPAEMEWEKSIGGRRLVGQSRGRREMRRMGEEKKGKDETDSQRAII